MNNTTSNKKQYWRYLLYIVVIGLILWPTSRVFFQQQLMKIGFFQPKFENKDTSDQTVAATESISTENQASFITAEGQVVNTVDLKGKIVFMNFWATWCGPCVAEMPSIKVLYDKFKDNDQVVFLLVEVDSNVEGAKEFMLKQKLNLPIYFPNGNIPSTWLDGAIPSTVILNKQGNISETKQGMFDYSGKGVQDYIQSLIDQK